MEEVFALTPMYSVAHRLVLKSNNFQYDMLGCWFDHLIDPESDEVYNNHYLDRLKI
jgi:hypothetical protein